MIKIKNNFRLLINLMVMNEVQQKKITDVNFFLLVINIHSQKEPAIHSYQAVISFVIENRKIKL